MKKVLILDTSSEVQIVCFVDKGIIKTFKKHLGKKDYVKNMIPLIDEVLKKNNTEIKDLDAIIVGIGPGSYTGTRVGVLTSKIISLFCNINLYQISSLILLTSGYDDQYLTPCLKLKNNYFFSSSLENNNIILPEGRYDNILLNKYKNHILINNDTIKFNFVKICSYMEKVVNIHKLIPNYLIQKNN